MPFVGVTCLVLTNWSCDRVLHWAPQREPQDLLSLFEDLAGTQPLKEAITVTQSEPDTAVTAAITVDESMLAVEGK